VAGKKDDRSSMIQRYRERLEAAKDFGDVWEIVKDSVKEVLKQHRVGMMLFLDDLPLQLGAYHPVGTNNIVMNRTLMDIVKASTDSRIVVNAFAYSILLHEYLHAIGYLSEAQVRPLVVRVSEECFGPDHVATQLARAGPWSILKGVPLDAVQAPRRVMEIVKGFERPSQRYIT
jgi:hypothetical protein